jgi:hypothetical protein
MLFNVSLNTPIVGGLRVDFTYLIIFKKKKYISQIFVLLSGLVVE